MRFGHSSHAHAHANTHTHTHATSTTSHDKSSNSNTSNSGASGPTEVRNNLVLPRYYTKFSGTSGLSAPELAAYALLQVNDWRHRIYTWQEATLQASQPPEHIHSPPCGPCGPCGAGSNPSGGNPFPDRANHAAESSGDYYGHMLFNELYFLADGGTVWTDSTAGVSNQTVPTLSPPPPHTVLQPPTTSKNYGTETRIGQMNRENKEGGKGSVLGATCANDNNTVRSSNSQDALLEPLYGKCSYALFACDI